MSPELNCVDKANKNWLSYQCPYKDGKTIFRLAIFSHSSTNSENLTKIDLVGFEIQRNWFDRNRKKIRNKQQNISPKRPGELTSGDLDKSISVTCKVRYNFLVQKTTTATPTRPLSSSLVIMTIVDERCSQTIRQKSQNVSGKGPCTKHIYTEPRRYIETKYPPSTFHWKHNPKNKTTQYLCITFLCTLGTW